MFLSFFVMNGYNGIGLVIRFVLIILGFSFCFFEIKIFLLENVVIGGSCILD